jgi:hypothetical protein
MRKRSTSRNAIRKIELELEEIAEVEEQEDGVATLVAFIADGLTSGVAEVAYALPHHASSR